MKIVRLVFLSFVGLMSSSMAQSSSCGTPSECFELALSELTEAKEEIVSLRADLARTKAKLNRVVSDDLKWVGESTGLVGPQGPRGSQGTQGPQGAQGPKGDAGTPLTIRWFDPQLGFSLGSDWGEAKRKTDQFCKSEGYKFGVPNGHGRNQHRGVHCIK